VHVVVRVLASPVADKRDDAVVEGDAIVSMRACLARVRRNDFTACREAAL